MVLKTEKSAPGTKGKELSIQELLKEVGVKVGHAEDHTAEAETVEIGIHPVDLIEEDLEAIAERGIKVEEDLLMTVKGNVTPEEDILDQDPDQGREKGGREKLRKDMRGIREDKKSISGPK